MLSLEETQLALLRVSPTEDFRPAYCQTMVFSSANLIRPA